MNFPFLHTEQYLEDIEIEDIGNCCINCINDAGEEWYLFVHTELGFTTIKQFGPLLADMDGLQWYFNYSQTKIEFNEKKIHKIINDFLNNNNRAITQAELIDRETMNNRFLGLKLEI